MKALTQAQQIYGKDFDNTPIFNERPAELRSTDPAKDKQGFRRYKQIMRQQAKNIKYVLR